MVCVLYRSVNITYSNTFCLDVCYCDVPVAVSDGIEDSQLVASTLLNLVDVCIGPAVSPCICNTTTCKVRITYLAKQRISIQLKY